jgi:predicted glutamine amidotransferase
MEGTGMCRLLGMVSRTPTQLTASLDDLLGPFTELSGEHCDGWGLAAWNGSGLATAKGIDQARSSQCFRSAVAAPVTDAALLHLRKASPGLPVVPANTHPFTAGTLAFAHNGYFTPVDAVDDLIDDDELADAAGTTDSERYFRLVLTRMRYQDPVDAIASAAADIRSRTELGSLNCLLLTEHALYAYAEENPFSEVRRRRGPDFFRLRYHAEADRVAVASSGVAPHPEDWTVLPYRHVLEISRADLRVSTHAVHSTHTKAGAGGCVGRPGRA